MSEKNIDLGSVETIWSICGTPIYEVVDDDMKDTDYPNYREVGVELCDACKKIKENGGERFKDYPCARYYPVATYRGTPGY
jgi:hypothetical protein